MRLVKDQLSISLRGSGVGRLLLAWASSAEAGEVIRTVIGRFCSTPGAKAMRM